MNCLHLPCEHSPEAVRVTPRAVRFGAAVLALHTVSAAARQVFAAAAGAELARIGQLLPTDARFRGNVLAFLRVQLRMLRLLIFPAAARLLAASAAALLLFHDADFFALTGKRIVPARRRLINYRSA